MKRITVISRREDLTKLEPILNDLLYFKEESPKVVRVEVYLPDERLDELVNAIQDVLDFRYKSTLLEVSTPDFVVSSYLKRAEKKLKGEERTPVEKLVDTTKPYTKLDYGKLLLTSIAGTIALAGLFMNNVAVIIGAMLLSPLLGPIYSFAINVAVGKVDYAIKSVLNLLTLISFVVFFSYIATLMISTILTPSLTPEIISRMSSSYIYILIAILLGFASVLSLSKGVAEGIAGVAIAPQLYYLPQ